jgi:hypothetical protein
MSEIKGRRGVAKNQRAKQRNAHRKAENLKKAKAYQLTRSKMSVKDKIASLDKRLGVGQGAKRERAKLEALLQASNQ